MITTDALIGAGVWLLWHALLAGPALAAAPRPVGAATHVLWDEFTHAEGWGPAHLGALRLEAGGLAGYGWAQYGSGVLGALAIAWWLRRWWVRSPRVPVPPSGRGARWTWPGLVALAVVVGAVAATGDDDLGSAGFAAATRGGSAAAVALVLAAGWHVRRYRSGRTESPSGRV